MMKSKTLGIIGGLGEIAGADLFSKLVHCHASHRASSSWHFLCEQHPFKDRSVALASNLTMTSRKLYVFQTCHSFAARHVDSILLPCFASHVFRDEIQSEFDVPLLDMMEALYRDVRRRLPSGSLLGILTSDFVRQSGLFERYFDSEYNLTYPTAAAQADLMSAIYAPDGIKAGRTERRVLNQLGIACQDLLEQKADLLLPGFTELSLVTKALRERGMPLLDANQIYAEFALVEREESIAQPFKLGIVGGVGPAATVDFMGKVLRNTPAGCDQDHIKMIVEHNPQIPDRTANLLHGKTDPTVALLATCKRLEAGGARAIAIPCNTAHAFVDTIQPHLTIPIINMLSATISQILEQHDCSAPVGLLATNGTISSGIYHAIAERSGLQLIVPEPIYQDKVMSAIYGEFGVKAGYTDGQCKAELLEAAQSLVRRGAKVLILGCTELPLLLPQAALPESSDQSAALIDPAEILAQRCVRLSMQ